MLAWKLCTIAALVAAWLPIARAGDAPQAKETVPGKPPANSPQSRSAAAAAAGGLTITAEGVSADWSSALPSFWLGIVPSVPSPALQAQLNLAKDQGLVVEDVMPDSPALKAGLKQYDILLKGNDKPLGNLRDLLELVNLVKDGKLKLEVLRGGKHENITVAPVKRPADIKVSDFTLQLDGLMAHGVSNAGEGRPLEFRIIGPGQILPGKPTAKLPGEGAPSSNFLSQIKTTLSDGSKVEITCHGADPAKITVTRDKDKWEARGNDLGKLPEKVRPEIEKLLHSLADRCPAAAAPGSTAGGQVRLFGAVVASPGFPGSPVVSPAVERRLAEMQKQIDELRQTLDALRKDKAK